MKKPIHSRESIKLYPAPKREDYSDAGKYARACYCTERKRVRYEQSNFLVRWILRLAGGQK